MRRLPHLATVLRPSTVLDSYDDEVEGPLAPVGTPFPAWLQVTTSTTSTTAEGDPVITTVALYFRPDIDVLLEEDDVVEVEGKRYRIDGDPYGAVSPRGRVRIMRAALKRVERGK